jgi:hypothetical protein
VKVQALQKRPITSATVVSSPRLRFRLAAAPRRTHNSLTYKRSLKALGSAPWRPLLPRISHEARARRRLMIQRAISEESGMHHASAASGYAGEQIDHGPPNREMQLRKVTERVDVKHVWGQGRSWGYACAGERRREE